MKARIFYFSGTGNTLFVARGIAQELSGLLTPIQTTLRDEVVEVDADTVGIAFPIYYATLPSIVDAFVRRLVVSRNAYLFSVCTYGGGPGDSTRAIRRILEPRGIRLSAAFGVHMRQNAFHKAWENTAVINRRAVKKIAKICRRVASGKKGQLASGFLWSLAMSPMNGLLKRVSRDAMARISSSSADAAYDELLHRADMAFRTNAECNGCGTCARVCPTRNIVVQNGRPLWAHRCENCLACYNWCPRRAIEGAIAKPGYFYRHPEARLIDFTGERIFAQTVDLDDRSG